MKKFFSAVAAVAALTAGAAQAQSANFDVVINLTSACEFGTVNNVTFSYTSFQAAASTATGGGFQVRCTNTLPYTLALDSTSVTDDAVNLAYTLSLSAAGGTGSGAFQNYTVSGSMASGQAGTCATASCTNASATNRQRTLTVSF